MIKFVKGNEAVVIGALYAGCDAFFGYPITPASEIAHSASEYFPAVGREFLQAECETASINMVYGAASAGKLAMTASSGPGISLMQEGLSYMAGAELPGVIVNIQRAGPGLGNVYPEQGDYNQAVRGGGHGNYRCLVLAPGNVQEMCDLTLRAFTLAFRYRNPVIVLADAVLGQMMETLRLPQRESPRPAVQDWAVQGTAATRPHLITSIYLNAPMQEEHNLRLQAKYASLQHESEADLYRADDADVLLAAYGISSRIARTAVDALRERGVKAGLFRPLTLYPFPVEALRRAAAGRLLAAVELSAGQFRDDLAFHLGRPADSIRLINRMGGMLVTVDQVVDSFGGPTGLTQETFMPVKKTLGFYPSFDRSGAPSRSTHYCPGCGHGLLHKLIGEALVELGLQDRTVIVNPIGCAVFGYYYWDAGNIGAAHGRAQAVGTALNRLLPQAVVIAYQGDGDLGAIGFNCTFQAAGRGEHLATFFVNNATYGMTGGQMAPTTLLGQKTATSPAGRLAAHEGYPLHVCETLNQLQAPVYIERCSLADTTRILQARKAVRKALEIQRDGKGYAFVEFLAPCPTNMGIDALQSARFTIDQLEAEYPLGLLRDRSAEAPARPARPAAPSPADFFGGHQATPDPLPDPAFPEHRIRIAGFGGQGILSLGIVLAEAGRGAGQFTSWLPSYGPEQRGGAASCAVVISGRSIGSPDVDKPDVLVCMNRPALEKFLPTVKPGGLVIYDAVIPPPDSAPAGVRLAPVPATSLAEQLGVPRAANTVMLAALASLKAAGLPAERLLEALDGSFARKPKLIPVNRKIFEAAFAWCEAHLA